MTRKTFRPETSIFLTILGITAAVWILRGIGLLTFLPGGIIWLLILLSVGSGVYSAIQGTRR